MIILVAYIHYYGATLGTNISEIGASSGSDPGSILYDSLRNMMSHVVSHSAVPTFFLISGYYFFYRCQHFTRESYLQKIRKRVHTLFIPYLLWVTLHLLLCILIPKVGAVFVKGRSWSTITDYLQEHGWLDLYWSSSQWGVKTDWLGHVISPANTGPSLIPMWFLRDLMVVSLLSPLLEYCLRKFGRIFLTLLALCYISKIWIYLPGLSITAFLFFSTGAYFAIHGKSVLAAMRKIRIPAYALYALMLIPTVIYDGSNTPIGGFIYPIFVATGVAVYMNLAADMLQRGWVRPHKKLAQSTFFVYGMHCIYVLRYSGSALRKLLPGDNAVIASLRYMLTPLLCVTVCYLLYVGLVKYCPRVASLLTGDRR